MIVAITGTPGTGKSSACAVLSVRGYAVMDLDVIARREGFIAGRDEARGSDEVDTEAMRRSLHVSAKVAFLTSHYSHRMDANIAIVLRCRPSVLRSRLEERGWPEAKVRENVEAEAINVILQEATSRLPFVFEIDTSNTTAAQTAERVLAILQGKREGHEPGSVDWSDEVLS